MDKFIWFLLTFALLLCNCGSHVDSAAPSDQPAVVTPQPASSVKSSENSSECVRSEPEPVVKKDVFPNTSFRLETNKEFPYQKLDLTCSKIDLLIEFKLFIVCRIGI